MQGNTCFRTAGGDEKCHIARLRAHIGIGRKHHLRITGLASLPIKSARHPFELIGNADKPWLSGCKTYDDVAACVFHRQRFLGKNNSVGKRRRRIGLINILAT